MMKKMKKGKETATRILTKAKELVNTRHITHSRRRWWRLRIDSFKITIATKECKIKGKVRQLQQT